MIEQIMELEYLVVDLCLTYIANFGFIFGFDRISSKREIHGVIIFHEWCWSVSWEEKKNVEQIDLEIAVIVKGIGFT